MSDLFESDVPAAQQPIFKTLREIVNTEVTSTWEDAWKAKVTPWDAGSVQPPLPEVIERNPGGIEWPKSGHALVPGCGAGYDVVYLASTLGLTAVGLDASETALEKANAFIKANPLPKGGATFELVDFFTYKPDHGFDLIYDYTFFVAIPPSRRNEWGKKMAELTNPGGYLVTLVFPIDPWVESGPPHYVRPEHYDEPLSFAFDKVFDRIPEKSSPTHVGRERMVVWKRKAD
ncbi:S-adenosyl-L-methionine-dependent methyltransferase [Macrolepiota fuliginosa MF-IS2]|uniref:S-adenosyl-L-methionine-dependent methyltransferase n=1 Tax=Macrolepiota fuliginosa MF-IS2 TaxID=1400762 RepID=A0A9P5XAY6_9AGAR|nr:S-adenosyl-L-methionine-dependent methyltransferase [Macrolepiota fuliginosa MF-IS2]